MSSKEAEEKVQVIMSKPAIKILGAEDAEQFKALLETVCRAMGYTRAYVSKSWGSVGVVFLPER